MRDIQERYSWWIDLCWIIGLMTLAVVLRVIYGEARDILIDHDSAGYILRAREIFSGGPLFDLLKVPGYPLLIGFWSTVVGDYILAAKVASIVSGSLLSMVAYFFGKRLYGRSVGITAALLVAINVALIQVATWELTEATYSLAMFCAAAVTVWAAKCRHLGVWAFAGMLYGISYWVRPEGFFYLGLIPLIAFIDYRYLTRKAFSKDFVLSMSAFALAGMVFVIPNVMHIHHQTGAWTISGKTVWAALVYSTDLKDSLAIEKAVSSLTPDKQSTMLEGGIKKVSMFANFSHNLLFKVRAMIENWIKTYKLLPSVFPPILILFIGIGLFQLRWTFQERLAEVYLLGVLIPWVFIYPLYNIDFENLTPIVPILTLWASLGLITMTRRIGPGNSSLMAFGFRKSNIIMAGVLLIVAFIGLPDYTRPMRWPDFYRGSYDEPAYRQVAEWIKKNMPGVTTLMARKAFISTYADRRWITLPYADYQDVIDYARLKKVEVIIMEEKDEAYRPQLAFLFNDPIHLEELRPIFTSQDKAGKKIILYEVLPAPRLYSSPG